MSSLNKVKKLKNSYLHWSFMKHKVGKLKRLYFYTAAQRKINNTINE